MPVCPEHSELRAALVRIEAELAAQRADQRRIVVAVCGDLEERQQGLLHRVAHLERQERARNRFGWACVTAAVGAAFAAVAAWMSGGGK
jgi:CHASE3 domain sensor protein